LCDGDDDDDCHILVEQIQKRTVVDVEASENILTTVASFIFPHCKIASLKLHKKNVCGERANGGTIHRSI
jgi:hypothetical protein